MERSHLVKGPIRGHIRGEVVETFGVQSLNHAKVDVTGSQGLGTWPEIVSRQKAADVICRYESAYLLFANLSTNSS